MIAPPNSYFLENPDRAVFIRREIDHSLFKEILPQVVSLRQTSEPICVYLDSPGGDVFFAELISNLIHCPNQLGQTCSLTTIGIGHIASCAADLLAMGDYSIIYPFAGIHYHGTRQQSAEITLEKIPSLAGSLRRTNEQFAFRLASKMFRRMTFIIVEMCMQNAMKKASEGTPTEGNLFDISKIQTDIREFEKLLVEKLAVVNGQTHLLNDALAKRTKLHDLVQSLRPFGDVKKGVDVKNQVELYKHLLDLEVRANPDKKLVPLLPVIEGDYREIRNFFFGRYQKQLHAIITESQEAFLSPTEVKECHSKPTVKEKTEFILRTVAPRFAPLWFLAVSLAKTLQEGEYSISPVEAYWLGLVDEVIGVDLPCLRVRTAQVMRASESEKSATPPEGA